MPAPSFDAALKALSSIDPNELDRDSWRNVSMAFRQCATGLAPDSFIHDCWQAFCTQYERNDRAENDTLWRSCDGGTSEGWRSEERRDGKACLSTCIYRWSRCD